MRSVCTPSRRRANIDDHLIWSVAQQLGFCISEGYAEGSKCERNTVPLDHLDLRSIGKGFHARLQTKDNIRRQRSSLQGYGY